MDFLGKHFRLEDGQSPISIDLHSNEDEFVVKVTDYGGGIKRSFINEVFKFG